MQFGIIRVVPREYNVPSLCWDGAFFIARQRLFRFLSLQEKVLPFMEAAERL